jgi:hypothetical protein
MKTTELKVRLAESDARFLEEYALAHAITIGELVSQYAHDLRNFSKAETDSSASLAGSVPTDTNAREVYREYIEKKHR